MGISRLQAMTMLYMVLAVGMSGGRIIKDGQYHTPIPYIDTYSAAVWPIPFVPVHFLSRAPKPASKVMVNFYYTSGFERPQ